MLMALISTMAWRSTAAIHRYSASRHTAVEPVADITVQVVLLVLPVQAVAVQFQHGRKARLAARRLMAIRATKAAIARLLDALAAVAVLARQGRMELVHNLTKARTEVLVSRFPLLALKFITVVAAQVADIRMTVLVSLALVALAAAAATRLALMVLAAAVLAGMAAALAA